MRRHIIPYFSLLALLAVSQVLLQKQKAQIQKLERANQTYRSAAANWQYTSRYWQRQVAAATTNTTITNAVTNVSITINKKK